MGRVRPTCSWRKRALFGIRSPVTERALIFRSILRFDYPTKFELFDRLGRVAAQLEAVGGLGVEINWTEHRVSALSKGAASAFRTTVDLNSVVAEHLFSPAGKALGAEPPHADLVSGMVHAAEVASFTRMGYRMWILVRGPALRFDAIRSVFAKTSVRVDKIVESFGALTDIGYTIEAKSEIGQFLRIHAGPYRAEEFRKYFRADPEVPEGMIFDVDVWQTGLDMPEPNAKRFALLAEKTARRLILRFVDTIEKELDHDGS